MDADTVHDDAQKRVGAEVERRRIELGLGPADVIRETGVDPKTYRALERGERWPRDSNRTKIERALGWPPGTLERLLAGEDQPEPEDLELEAPNGEAAIGARLVLALDEVYARLHATILAPEVVASLPPGTEEFVRSLEYANHLAERLAVSVAGGGESLAEHKRAERARIRALTWAPPTSEHEADLESRNRGR